MNQKRWLDAVGRFKDKKAQEERETVEAAQATQEVAVRQGQERRQYAANVQVAAEELNRFISSEEGQVAQQLLAASGRHTIIAEENEGGGSGVVYFFDGNGLQRSIEPMGMWMVYTKKEDIPKPKISPVGAEEAVRLAIRQGTKPHEVVERIRRYLDNLAEEVL